MKDRIRFIQKDARMTQTEFADRIGISRTGIQKIQSGENNPSEQTIRAICSEFRVNRRWLETGEGEAYMKSERSADLAAEIRDILKGEHPMMIAAMAALAQMEPEWWDAWAKKLHEEVERAKKGDG